MVYPSRMSIGRETIWGMLHRVKNNCVGIDQVHKDNKKQTIPKISHNNLTQKEKNRYKVNIQLRISLV